MVGGPPPVQVGQQGWRLLCCGPGAACERCHPMSDGQWSPLDERRVQSSREASSLEGGFEICLCPQPHHRRDTHELAPPVAFLHLAVDQPRCSLPLAHFPPSPTHLEPLTKVGCEGIEVHIETITREDRQAARGQHLSERVDELVCRLLGAGTQRQYGQNLVRGSMASQIQSTWVELRSRVRISSNCRCGRCRLLKER
jgi:hypothetical protein